MARRVADPEGRIAQSAPVAALLAITAIWASTFVVIKGGLDGTGPFTFVALRFGLAAFVLATIFAPRLRRTSVGDWQAAGVLGLWLFGGYALQTLGLQSSTASKGGFITGLAVVLVPVGVWLWKRQPPGLRYGAGALAATIGLGLLTLDGDLTPEIGDLLLLGCAVAFAGHIIALGYYARRRSIEAIIVGQVALTAGLATVAALLVEPRAPIPFASLAAAVYTALAATVLVLVLQTWAQRSVSANRTAIIFAAEPVFAAIFAVMLGGETLGLREIAGGGLIVAGMTLAVAEPDSPLT
jgi:drug/metabolite transporter (DMT)-like permease